MSLNSIEKHLLAIEQLYDIPILNHIDIERHLNYITKFPVLTFNIPTETYVYRATTSFINEHFSSTSRISNAPEHLVKNYGRVNFPQQSFFYCSENYATSYLELINYWVKNISLGQFFYVTMGEWQTTEQIQSIIVTTPDKAKRQTIFEISSGDAFDNKMLNFNNEERAISELIYNKLYEWYSKPAKVGDNVYKITSSFSNKLLKAMKRFGILNDTCIMYPSVADLKKGVNFAFEPGIIKSGKLKLIRAWRIKLIVMQKEDGFYDFKEVERELATIKDNGSLVW